MFDPKKLLDDLLGSNVPGTTGTVRDKAGQAVQMAKDNPLAAGAIAAVLLGTGTGRGLTGSVLKIGGLAAIGGLAYKAYQNYQNGKSPEVTEEKPQELLPPPADTSFHPSQMPEGETEFALTLIRAMIAAAKADGHIDDEERRKIGDRLALSGMDAEAGRFVNAELAKSADIDELVAAAKTDAQKVELYTASRLAVTTDTRAERGYLDLLAGRLNLPENLVNHIEATVAQVTVARVDTASAAPVAAEQKSPL